MPAPLIIGGGPAGAAAAIVLAQAGRGVTLIERTAGPADKVCGDFLSGEAMGTLRTLGVAMPDAAPIGSLRLVHGLNQATTRLPFAAFGVTRRALDAALLRHAASIGAVVMHGHSVRGIERHAGTLRVRCTGLDMIETDAVFLATGKHDLRGATRDAADTGLVGLKMYFALDAIQIAALRDHVELVLIAGGYAGLQLVEADAAVLCALVPRVRLAAVGGWDGLLASLTSESSHLAGRLAGARALLPRPLAVANLPYGFVHTPLRYDPPGLFRLGDQAAVIPSFTGDGVALALASGTHAAHCWLRHGADAALYHRRNSALMWRQMRLAMPIQRMALRPGFQRWLVAVGRACPWILRWAAAATRCDARITSAASSR